MSLFVSLTPEAGASLPIVILALILLPKVINPALPEKMVMVSPEAIAKQDNADFPQDPLSPFYSVPISVLVHFVLL